MAELIRRSEILSMDVIEPHMGGVRIEDKKVPTFTREDVDEDELAFVFGEVDTSALKSYLTEHLEIFQPEHQQTNVNLTRPAHDRWGVGKVMFRFCDDFMLRVFEFPWWHDPFWQSHLLPIFETLGVPPHRIMRCLLACIPPSVNIPIHHDTGLWVSV